MLRRFSQCFFLLLVAGLAAAQQPHPAINQFPPTSEPAIHVEPWTAPKVQHAYGLPETKPKAPGTILIDDSGLTFASKASRYTIPWARTVLMSDGIERVEMWGTTGRIVRMVIPNGGGLAAAGVMHHKVNELTVDFRDDRGGYHGAVFYVAAEDAAHILDIYTHTLQPEQEHSDPDPLRSTAGGRCDSNSGTRSVLVLPPSWNQADVPMAYRAMVYEHLVDRLQHVKGVDHVYRYGDTEVQKACPQYNVSISVETFRPGNQVHRAMMGPVGLFAGTTHISFNATIRDASGKLNVSQEVKATVRGDGESKTIADVVAKKIAKSYAATTKQFESGSLAARANSPLTR